MKKIPINNLNEFLDKLQKNCPTEGNLMYFYRGEGVYYKASVSNKPKVFANGRIANEDRILRDAIRLFPDVYTSKMSTFQKLVRMRHYGLAVRLLDISLSPLVALFFACCDSIDAKATEEKEHKEGHVMYTFSNKIHHQLNIMIVTSFAYCPILHI